MGGKEKDPNNKESQKNLKVDRMSIRDKIQYLESRLNEKSEENKRLQDASNDLKESNQALADSNTKLSEANTELAKANQKLVNANEKLIDSIAAEQSAHSNKNSKNEESH